VDSALRSVGLVGLRKADIGVPDASDVGVVVFQSPSATQLVAPGSTVQFAIGVFNGDNR
jgi:hypothetical protein